MTLKAGDVILNDRMNDNYVILNVERTWITIKIIGTSRYCDDTYGRVQIISRSVLENDTPGISILKPSRKGLDKIMALFAMV